MHRWPWVLIGAAFLAFDLLVAGYVYAQMDPGAANRALSRLHLAPAATSVPTLPLTSTPTSLPFRLSTNSGLVGVQGTSWAVDKWHPSTRIEIGVGGGFTGPDHSNARRQYFFLTAYEANRPGSGVHFASSARDFALYGSNKTVYSEMRAFPASTTVPAMQLFKDLPPGTKNAGGIAFDIPVRSGTYLILWKESNAAGWAPVARVVIGPGHRPIISAAS